MSFLRLHIERPYSPVEQMDLEGEQLLVGTAAHCDVRLPLDQGMPEHLQIRFEPGAFWVRAMAFEPQALLNGVPFGDAPLTDGAILTIGDVRIHVSLPERPLGLPSETRERKTSPVIVIGGAIIAVLLWTIVSRAAPAGLGDSRGTPPELWSKEPDTCPRSDARQARSLAIEKLVAAKTKRERRPFNAHDGVAAVPLFRAAAACFTVAGEGNASREATNAADALQDDVKRDYRTHQMRLDHAISVEDNVTVLAEMEALLSFTEGKTGPYVTWLTVNQRQLRLQTDQAKKEK